jgi:hypothetical protein
LCYGFLARTLGYRCRQNCRQQEATRTSYHKRNLFITYCVRRKTAIMLVIDLHNALLLGSQFSTAAQFALTVTLKAELLKQSQSNAVLLLWLAGSTSKQTPELQQQLDALTEAGVLQTLVDLLPDVDHCSSATTALLQCISKLASTAAPKQLSCLLADPVNQTHIVSASCSSAAAAAAAASLKTLALSRGLPAASLLQPLLVQANSTSAPAGTSASCWATTAMPPLLEQLQQQLINMQKGCVSHQTRCVSHQEGRVSQHPAELLPLSPQQQELWLLLSAVAAVAHRAGPSTPLTALSKFFSNPAVVLAMQAALLGRSAPAVQAAAIYMVSTLAGLSVDLAQCCFKAVAPVVTELLLVPAAPSHSHSNSSSCSSTVAAQAAADVQHLQHLSLQQQSEAGALARFDQAVAVHKMWGLLLQRVGSRQLLEAEVGEVGKGKHAVVLR